MRAGTGETFEIGKGAEREIHFAGGAAEFVAADAFKEIGGELARLEKFFKGEMRVDAGGDDAGEEFLATLQRDTAGTAVFCKNFSDGRFGADLCAGFTGGVGDGVRNGAGATAAEAPGTKCAV